LTNRRAWPEKAGNGLKTFKVSKRVYVLGAQCTENEQSGAPGRRKRGQV
jgi:hypothetical protein